MGHYASQSLKKKKGKAKQTRVSVFERVDEGPSQFEIAFSMGYCLSSRTFCQVLDGTCIVGCYPPFNRGNFLLSWWTKI